MCMKENVKCFKGTGNVVWENDENIILDSRNRSRSMPIIVSIIFYFY